MTAIAYLCELKELGFRLSEIDVGDYSVLLRSKNVVHHVFVRLEVVEDTRILSRASIDISGFFQNRDRALYVVHECRSHSVYLSNTE